MMNDYELIGELFKISGPVLRWRIANEFSCYVQCDKEELANAVLEHPDVQKYIQYFKEGANQGEAYLYTKMIHGSKVEQLENTAGKLWSFGIGKGFEEIDCTYDFYEQVLIYDFNRKNVMRTGYGMYQIPQMLSLLGYANQGIIKPILQTRLDQVYTFVKQGRYDIYVGVKGYPSLPSSWKHINKIIDPALTQYGDAEGEPPLPSYYDILGMVGMSSVGLSEENENKFNAILAYCLNERYQKDILPGYGVLLAPTGRYYSMGWSVHLPGAVQPLSEDIEINRHLLWAEIISRFSVSRNLPLFTELFDFLERYQDDYGFFTFPRKFIPEEKSGYFVMGKYMGLGEDRKKRDMSMIESTFRVLSLKRNLGILMQ